MAAASNPFTADTTTLPAVTTSAPDLLGAHSAQLHGHIDPAGWATGTVQSGQFVLLNVASPFDVHLVPTPPLAGKTAPTDVAAVATGLIESSTYLVQLQVPSVNGTAIEPTADTVTTTGLASQLVYATQPPAAAQAGASFPVTATTEDPFGNVVHDFAGSVSLALSVPGVATLSGTATQPLVNGVSSFTGLSVDKTGTYTLTATATPLTAALSSSLTINPGPLDHLALTPASATIGAGGSQAYTAERQDFYNNSLGDVTLATSFAITPDGSCTGASCTATVADGASTHHTVTGTEGGKTGIASLTVNAAALDHLVLTPASATITAGGSQAYTAQGQDVYNNSLGDVTLATSFAITPDGSCTGASCTATVADGASTYHTVTGTDSGKTGSASLTVNPAATSQVVFSALATTASVNTATTFALTAEDAYGNTTPTYVGQVHFTSTDGTAVPPSDYTFGALENGVHPGFSITFMTAGSWTISAHDTTVVSIAGTSGSVIVS
jgi:hypothetical protein